MDDEDEILAAELGKLGAKGEAIGAGMGAQLGTAGDSRASTGGGARGSCVCRAAASQECSRNRDNAGHQLLKSAAVDVLTAQYFVAQGNSGSLILRASSKQCDDMGFLMDRLKCCSNICSQGVRVLGHPGLAPPQERTKTAVASGKVVRQTAQESLVPPGPHLSLVGSTITP